MLFKSEFSKHSFGVDDACDIAFFYILLIIERKPAQFLLKMQQKANGY